MDVEVVEEHDGDVVEGVADVGLDAGAVLVDGSRILGARDVAEEFVLVDGEGFEAVGETGFDFCVALTGVTGLCTLGGVVRGNMKEGRSCFVPKDGR